MGVLKNFVSPLHKQTKRNYIERMNNEKVNCSKVAKRYEKEIKRLCYSIKDEIISTIKMSKYCKLYDFRDSNISSDFHFLDGYHLNESGASIFTINLIDNLQLAN